LTVKTDKSNSRKKGKTKKTNFPEKSSQIFDGKMEVQRPFAGRTKEVSIPSKILVFIYGIGHKSPYFISFLHFKTIGNKTSYLIKAIKSVGNKV
jgi:hypothetical protein